MSITKQLSKWPFVAVLLAALVADIATKAWADIVVRPTDPRVTEVIPGLIAWKWAENEGAAFSILHGRPMLLALIAGVILVSLFIYAWLLDPRRRLFLIGLALVASGAIGNLYDRLLLGHVRDFIYFDFDLPGHGTKLLFWTIPQRWPIFNIADIAIFVGVGILMALSFKAEKKAEKKAAETKADEKKAEQQTEKHTEKTEKQPEPPPEPTPVQAEVSHGA